MTHDKKFGTPIKDQEDIILRRLNDGISKLNRLYIRKNLTQEDRNLIQSAIGRMLSVRIRMFGRGSGPTGRKWGERKE